jgi:enoyl-CoA hydratase
MSAAGGEGPFVRLERRDDGVALVTLDRPKMNALSCDLLEELHQVAAGLARDLPGAVVLTGGRRLFAAGADIEELQAGRAGDISAAFHRALVALETLPRAVVAAVNGYALGGGLELALACDLRVAADDARLGLPEILLGIIPGGGGTQRLPRLVGPAKAKELIWTGRQVRADEALTLGLVDRVVPADDVLGAALELAATLARGAVVAQGLAKGAVARAQDVALADGLLLEREAFLAAAATEDCGRGVASFLEHGPGRATFVGR